MCLVVIAFRAAAEWPFMLAANRDERHARPASAATWWRDRQGVIGGRDLEAGGTWLAMDLRGRVAAVTNVREEGPRQTGRSRGGLVAEFVSSDTAAAEYADTAARAGSEFAAFNLVLFDGVDLFYASNRAPTVQLDAGVHAYSNAPHGTDWPKVVSARARAAGVLGSPEPLERLFALLAERDGAASGDRYQREHFVIGAEYGTRCSTVLLVDAEGNAQFAERSFDTRGRLVGEVRESFRVQPHATARRAPAPSATRR
jgi:uncharacterized protein with NRDE domain